MADRNKITEWIKIPAYILGALTAIAVLFGALGFGWSTPGDAWEEHEVKHIAEMEVHQEQFAKIDIALDNIDDMQTTQQVLVEAIVIADCIDRTKEQLELQRLIPTCTELGIDKN